MVSGLLSAYHHSLTHRFSINQPPPGAPPDRDYFELASDADIFAMVLGFMIPLMFILFIFTGCQTLAPDCISGEKERGTLGSLLVTPAKRSDMAFAKILSITIFGLLGAVGSIIGMVLSLPRLFPMDGNIDFYSMGDYALLLLIAISTTLVFVSLLAVMSAYAKSVKEATAYSMPLMIVSMLCGLASMMTGGVPDDFVYYLIPVFNSALCITAVINFEVSIPNMLVALGANLTFSLICVFALTKIFNSEKIVFDK
jgi:sodium transport system permease protein